MAATKTLSAFVFGNLWFGGEIFTCEFFSFPLISYNISFCKTTTNCWCHLTTLIWQFCLPAKSEWKQQIDGILKTISIFLLESPLSKGWTMHSGRNSEGRGKWKADNASCDNSIIDSDYLQSNFWIMAQILLGLAV